MVLLNLTHHPDKQSPMARGPKCFTQEETAHLIEINRQLIVISNWLCQRGLEMAENFLQLSDKELVEAGVEDFELDCIIQYYGRPEQDGDDEDLILETSLPAVTLKWDVFNPNEEECCYLRSFLLRENWNEGLTDIDGLASQHICYPFHDLHDHHNLSWQQILRIERIWVDLQATHQMIR